MGAGAVGFGEVDFDDEVGVPPTLDRPTQEACSSQKLVTQFLETAGFQAKNWSTEMPLSLAMDPQLSPLTTTSHLLQSVGWPVCVGAGGVGAAVVEGLDDEEVVVTPAPAPDAPTQYACPNQKLLMQFLETAGFQAKNWSSVMPLSLASEPQLSPSAKTSHWYSQPVGRCAWEQEVWAWPSLTL